MPTNNTVRVSVLTPMIPNFLRIDGLDEVVPIWRLSDSELRSVARNWTALLLLTARNRRKLHQSKGKDAD